MRKLEIQGELERYNDIIQTQLSQGIVEHADEVVKDGKEFYIPHKAVVRENAESTKIRIVYDASARANASVPSLNECLEIGPPLQNQLWNVLVRNRFYPVAIAGDLKQAFLQIRVRREDRDALRFHWIKDLASKQVETLRFTRVLFGLAPSPFLLAAVIKQHLQRYKIVLRTSRGNRAQHVRRRFNQWRGDNKTSVRNQDDRRLSSRTSGTPTIGS